HAGQAAALAFRDVVLETRALLLRIAELVETVGELDAVEVRLEARRDMAVNTRQGRLRRGIVIDKGEPVEPELRTDERPHDQVEARIAIMRHVTRHFDAGA